MTRRWYAIIALIFVSPALAQEPAPVVNAPVAVDGANAFAPIPVNSFNESGRGFLTGDKGFPNFIGYITNPAKAIDPRSITQLFPLYDYVSLASITHTTRGIGPLPPRDITLVPAGEINLIGPGLSVALTERLNVGITGGAPAITSYPGRHQGWLDIGGYAQYTLIHDVPSQFIATAGMTWLAPSGSTNLFQGTQPWYLGTYVTVGKEFGDWHLLNTFGFDFPAGSGTVTRDTFYGTVHIDRRCFGWLYPLVEFNWAVATADFNLQDTFVPHLIGVDDFSANGNIVTVAPGFNAVIVPDHVELGAAYQTPIASQHHTHFNSFIVKLVLRY